jgi:hypothetical protein
MTSLQDKGITLSSLGEVQVDGKPALGLKVACKDQQDIQVFLDKTTGLPLQAKVNITDEHDKEATLEFTFSEFKEFNGRKHFTRVVAKREGVTLFEAEFSEFRWLDKLDAKTFDRP